MNRWALKQNGFTIVELLVIIVVIGILAGITIVSYNGIQQRAAEAAAKNDLTNVKKFMQIAKARQGVYPTTIPSDVQASSKISLTKISNTLPHYSGTTPVQNGVLFSEICTNLLNEGLGKGANMGGGTDNYITSCDNYNKNSIQITGWSTKVFSTPLAESTINTYINSVPAGDAWHPNQQPTIKKFYTELRDRFKASGGLFPVASFWDSWASPSNGVLKESLPEPDNADADETSYCVQAVYDNKADLSWHITENGRITQGTC
jgi:general secretion pathway protein G